MSLREISLHFLFKYSRYHFLLKKLYIYFTNIVQSASYIFCQIYSDYFIICHHSMWNDNILNIYVWQPQYNIPSISLSKTYPPPLTISLPPIHFFSEMSRKKENIDFGNKMKTWKICKRFQIPMVVATFIYDSSLNCIMPLGHVNV